jgi:hypothetical protein
MLCSMSSEEPQSESVRTASPSNNLRSLTREVLNPELSMTYTSIAAMLIESAAPFTVLGIGPIVTEAQGGPLAIAFSYVW